MNPYVTAWLSRQQPDIPAISPRLPALFEPEQPLADIPVGEDAVVSEKRVVQPAKGQAQTIVATQPPTHRQTVLPSIDIQPSHSSSLESPIASRFVRPLRETPQPDTDRAQPTLQSEAGLFIPHENNRESAVTADSSPYQGRLGGISSSQSDQILPTSFQQTMQPAPPQTLITPMTQPSRPPDLQAGQLPAQYGILTIPAVPTINPLAQAPKPEPVINITIGRIEVRAVQPAAKSKSQPASRPAIMGLDEYLRQRGDKP